MKEFIFKVGMPMKWILLLPMIGWLLAEEN
jgi:hypothetical protein